jgi:hypothetical protein
MVVWTQRTTFYVLDVMEPEKLRASLKVSLQGRIILGIKGGDH